MKETSYLAYRKETRCSHKVAGEASETMDDGNSYSYWALVVETRPALAVRPAEQIFGGIINLVINPNDMTYNLIPC